MLLATAAGSPASQSRASEASFSGHCILVLPQKPSVECAYLAFLAAAVGCSGTSKAVQRSRRLLLRKSQLLREGASCLLLKPEQPEHPEHQVVAELPEILRRSADLLEPPTESTQATTCPRMADCLGLSLKIREAAGRPSSLGPLVQRLCSIITSHYGHGGAGIPPRGAPPDFLGGERPGLLSDVPIAAALLTSTWWRAQLSSEDSASRISKLDGPLKGRDLVLWWFFGVMRSKGASWALRAACADEQVCDVELEDSSEYAAALSKAKPPLNQPSFSSPATPEQQAADARKREKLLQVKSSLAAAVKSGDVRQVADLLVDGAPVNMSIRMQATRGLPRGTGFSAGGAGSQRWTEVRLPHLAMSLCIKKPSSGDHAAHGIAADLGIAFADSEDSTGVDGSCLGAQMLQVLKAHGASLQADSGGLTPVFYAAMCGNTCCLKHLLALEGPKVFAQRDKFGRSALYWAAANNQKEATEWILAHCAGEIGVDDTNFGGQTVLAKVAWPASSSQAVARRILWRMAIPYAAALDVGSCRAQSDTFLLRLPGATCPKLQRSS